MAGTAYAFAALLAAGSLAAPVAAQDVAPPSCDYGAMRAGAPEELAQFDFLIGDYSVSVHAWDEEAQDWSAPRAGAPARWNGRWVLGGTAITDEWFDRDPGLEPDASRGVNVRMWDPQAGE